MKPKLALAATLLCLAGVPALAGKAPPAAPTAVATSTAAPDAAPAPRPLTAEERAEADRMDPLARAAFWAHAVDNDPRDTQAGVKLAKALRELSRTDEAQTAADRVLVMAPDDFEALLESARDHIAAGQGFFAIEPAQRAAALAPRDWRPQSLLGIALEQAQRDPEALAAHQKALALAPGNAAALSNLAMYQAAHGQAAEAESLLRRAVMAPGATVQERQNLALILGLEGKTAESEALERQDLPPAEVANNLAYLRPADDGAAQRSWSSVQSAR
ncbi:MAG TPA: pilus assembly protein TadD [Caulobacteraceae bacterium]